MIRRPAPSARVIVVTMTMLAVATFGLAPGASAQGCSDLDPSGTECGIGVGGGPGRPAPGGVNRSSDAPPGPRFSMLNTGIPCDASLGGGSTPTDDIFSAVFEVSALAGELGELDEPGSFWIAELIDPATGGGVGTGYISCVGDGEALAPPPPPPTAAQIWDEALTTQPSVELDPVVRGLTGLETLMWYEGGLGGTVDVGPLNGYAVSATIGPVEFVWDMGGADRDGVEVHASPVPGSPDAPAATHTYATPGLKEITHSVVWAGTAVITGPGVPAGGITVDLGTATLVVARDYDVIEVRTPVVGGDAQPAD